MPVKFAAYWIAIYTFIMKRWMWIAGIVGLSAVGGWWTNQESSRDSTTRDKSGQITEAGDLGAFIIKVGDCILLPNEWSEAGVDDYVEFIKLDGVPCTELHDVEIVSARTLPDGDFPGRDALFGALSDFCVPAYEKYVGIPFDTDAPHDIDIFIPSVVGWAEGDREIQCYASLTSGEQMGASIRG